MGVTNNKYKMSNNEQKLNSFSENLTNKRVSSKESQDT